MPILLGNKALTDENREKNNTKTDYKLIVYVLGVIFVYMYLFTQISHFIGIQSPEELFKSMGIIQKLFIFDNDTNLYSMLELNYTNNINYKNDGERFVFFTILILTFLASYFFKIKSKKIAIVTGTLLIFFIAFDWHNIFLFLAMHLILYLLFHSKNENVKYISYLPGFMIFFSFFRYSVINIGFLQIIYGVLASVFFAMYYKFLVLKILENEKVSNIIRTIFIQSTMILIIVFLIINAFFSFKWSIPIGLFLFFIQWQRLILYHIDYKDGLIPLDLSLLNYSLVFFNPSTTTNCVDGHVIGSGYRYINSNYLVEDKNKIILSGLKILIVALFYLVLFSWFTNIFKGLFEYFLGVPIFVNVEELIKEHLKGRYLETSTVLFSTLLYQIKWFFLFGGIVHFKVGVWRILGFKLDPYFDKPWLATNLISLWSRYSFYYREFLVKAFYYPVFLNFFKTNKNLRIFMATFASTCIGNYTWGHIPEILMVRGIEVKNLQYILPRWPYYLLLGLGISLTQLYLLNKTTNRKPWKKDWRIILDICCVYLTIQFFSLIHVFARPNSSASLWDYTTLFLIGCGIHLPR